MPNGNLIFLQHMIFLTLAIITAKAVEYGTIFL